MPALPEVLAAIDDGVVVNVSALSTENDYTPLMEAWQQEYDEVRLVLRAGVGWLDTPDGLRPEKPHEDATWDDANGWWVWDDDEPDDED